jgi:hypothetical protein
VVSPFPRALLISEVGFETKLLNSPPTPDTAELTIEPTPEVAWLTTEEIAEEGLDVGGRKGPRIPVKSDSTPLRREGSNDILWGRNWMLQKNE